jgi:chloramphenicol O-acetyltransferase type B
MDHQASTEFIKTSGSFLGTSPSRPIREWVRPFRSCVRLFRYAKHRLVLGRKLSLGRNVSFGKSVELRIPQFMRISDNVMLGSYFIAETNLVIGADVLISTRVSCIGNDHAFDDPNTTVFSGGRLAPCTIVLEGDNLIGFGTILVGNITVGRGCIVGAGSVVTSDLPQYSICAGVPAKPIRNRFKS